MVPENLPRATSQSDASLKYCIYTVSSSLKLHFWVKGGILQKSEKLGAIGALEFCREFLFILSFFMEIEISATRFSIKWVSSDYISIEA